MFKKKQKKDAQQQGQPNVQGQPPQPGQGQSQPQQYAQALQGQGIYQGQPTFGQPLQDTENYQGLTPLQIKRMQEEAEKAARKSFYKEKKSKKGMTDERREELEELNKVQNKVRFYNTIRSKDIDFKPIRSHRGITKKLKSKKSYTFNEVEQLFNEITQTLPVPITVNVLSEDTSTGHYYYFNDILLEPGKPFSILGYIQYDLSYFAEINNAPQLFISMNRQYQAERQLIQLQQGQSNKQGQAPAYPQQPPMQGPPQGNYQAQSQGNYAGQPMQGKQAPYTAQTGNPMQKVGRGFK